MTDKRKRTVRERMAITGESYSEALRQIGYQRLVESHASIENPQTPVGMALAKLIEVARQRYRPIGGA